MDTFNFCENPDFLYLFLVLNIAFKIVTILVPIIVMYRAIVPFAKAVISGEETSKYFPGIMKSIFAAFFIFMLPSLLTFIFSSLIPQEGVVAHLTVCFNNGNLQSIELYRKARQIEEEEEQRAVIEALNKAAAEHDDQDKAYNESIKNFKENQKEKYKQQQQNNNGGGVTTIDGTSPGTSPGSSVGSGSIPAGTVTIHIGDSRTVGMCGSVTDGYTGCSFNGTPKVYNNDIFIAKSAMGYDWFASTAVPAVNQIISSNPNNHYNILSYMGVNYLLSDLDKYIPKYNELANGAWKNQNVILVSVNPVNESVEAQHGYSTKNTNIVTFNTRLKAGISASNLRYCDTYNAIAGSFQTSDGLHYTSGTYQDIFNSAKSCI